MLSSTEECLAAQCMNCVLFVATTCKIAFMETNYFAKNRLESDWNVGDEVAKGRLISILPKETSFGCLGKYSRGFVG